MNLKELCLIEEIATLKVLQSHIEFIENFNNAHGTHLLTSSDVTREIDAIKVQSMMGTYEQEIN